MRNRGVRRALTKARAVGRTALTAAQASAVVKMKDQLGEGVELVLTPGLAQRDPAAALAAALELPERIARADNKRVVVFFDESRRWPATAVRTATPTR